MGDVYANFAYAITTVDASSTDTGIAVDTVARIPDLSSGDFYLTRESTLADGHFEIMKVTGLGGGAFLDDFNRADAVLTTGPNNVVYHDPGSPYLGLPWVRGNQLRPPASDDANSTHVYCLAVDPNSADQGIAFDWVANTVYTGGGSIGYIDLRLRCLRDTYQDSILCELAHDSSNGATVANFYDTVNGSNSLLSSKSLGTHTYPLHLSVSVTGTTISAQCTSTSGGVGAVQTQTTSVIHGGFIQLPVAGGQVMDNLGITPSPPVPTTFTDTFTQVDGVLPSPYVNTGVLQVVSNTLQHVGADVDSSSQRDFGSNQIDISADFTVVSGSPIYYGLQLGTTAGDYYGISYGDPGSGIYVYWKEGGTSGNALNVSTLPSGTVRFRFKIDGTQATAYINGTLVHTHTLARTWNPSTLAGPTAYRAGVAIDNLTVIYPGATTGGITVVRGQEGTTPQSIPAGTVLKAALTAGMIERLGSSGTLQAWQAVSTFANGFAVGGLGLPYSDPAYYLGPDGRVSLRGFLTSGSTANAVAFTLPAGYRPERVVQGIISRSSGSTRTFSTYSIDTSGGVTIYSAIAYDYISLDGISFRQFG